MANILLLSPGSKVALARIAARSAKMRGVALHAIDRQPNLPTRHVVDQFEVLKEKGWTSSLLEYCLTNEIGLIIPTRHSDLAPLATARSLFEEKGVSIAISSEATISVCTDKSKTYDFLKDEGIPTPFSFALNSQSIDTAKENLPFIAKPIRGSGSSGIQIVKRIEQVSALTDSGEYMGQKIAAGDEYTINCYLSRDGGCICSIPHKRIAVQNGESVQATTAKIPELIDLSNSVASKLRGARGPINIQVFYERKTGKIEVIEINPRVGGGYPLADKAGGRFIEWLAQEYLDGQDLEPYSNWTDGLRMMRYREATFDFPSPRADSPESA